MVGKVPNDESMKRMNEELAAAEKARAERDAKVKPEDPVRGFGVSAFSSIVSWVSDLPRKGYAYVHRQWPKSLAVPDEKPVPKMNFLEGFELDAKGWKEIDKLKKENPEARVGKVFWSMFDGKKPEDMMSNFLVACLVFPVAFSKYMIDCYVTVAQEKQQYAERQAAAQKRRMLNVKFAPEFNQVRTAAQNEAKKLGKFPEEQKAYGEKKAAAYALVKERKELFGNFAKHRLDLILKYHPEILQDIPMRRKGEYELRDMQAIVDLDVESHTGVLDSLNRYFKHDKGKPYSLEEMNSFLEACDLRSKRPDLFVQLPEQLTDEHVTTLFNRLYADEMPHGLSDSWIMRSTNYTARDKKEIVERAEGVKSLIFAKYPEQFGKMSGKKLSDFTAQDAIMFRDYFLIETHKNLVKDIPVERGKTYSKEDLLFFKKRLLYKTFTDLYERQPTKKEVAEIKQSFDTQNWNDIIMQVQGTNQKEVQSRLFGDFSRPLDELVCFYNPSIVQKSASMQDYRVRMQDEQRRLRSIGVLQGEDTIYSIAHDRAKAQQFRLNLLMHNHPELMEGIYLDSNSGQYTPKDKRKFTENLLAENFGRVYKRMPTQEELAGLSKTLYGNNPSVFKGLLNRLIGQKR